MWFSYLQQKVVVLKYLKMQQRDVVWHLLGFKALALLLWNPESDLLKWLQRRYFYRCLCLLLVCEHRLIVEFASMLYCFRNYNLITIWTTGFCHTGLFSKTTRLEKLLICWFTFTGLIHLIVEGYFAFTPDFIKDKNGFYLAEICNALVHQSPCDTFYFSPGLLEMRYFFSSKLVWCFACAGKEYSKGDSRYASFDSAIVAVEMVTAVAWGPACLLVA